MSLARRIRTDGGWIPLAFLAFFGVVLAANGAMVYFAYSSWTGVEAPNAYQRGLHFNEAIAAREAQDRLGWQVLVAFTPRGRRAGTVEVWVSDADGAWLDGADARAALVRPTHSGNDFEVALAPDGPGRYRAAVELPLSGQWDLRVSIHHDRGTYRTVRRIDAP